jgi:hypothetical protein
MLRHTIMPKVENSDAICIPYYEAIRAIMSRDKLNIVEWMATRMVECRLNRRGALVFQPYIMALIHHKTSFLGIDGAVHRHFHPFMNKKEALEQEGSPPPKVPRPPIVAVAGEGARIWTPLEDYFVPYFERLNR